MVTETKEDCQQQRKSQDQKHHQGELQQQLNQITTSTADELFEEKSHLTAVDFNLKFDEKEIVQDVLGQKWVKILC